MKITYGTIWYYGATWCLTELNEALDSTAVGFRASVVYHAAKDSTASLYPPFAFLSFSFFLSFHCPFLWSTNWAKPLGRTDFASPTPRKLAATFPIHFPLFSCSRSDQPIAASNFFEVLLYLSIRNPSVLTPVSKNTRESVHGEGDSITKAAREVWREAGRLDERRLDSK